MSTSGNLLSALTDAELVQADQMIREGFTGIASSWQYEAL